MLGMKDLNLNPDEQLRLSALTHLTEGRLTVGEVAVRLKLSERQVQRLHRAFLAHGEVALVHGNRGKHPSNALPQERVEQILELARNKYENFNHTYLAEMLKAEEGIDVARRTVSRHLTAHDERSPKQHRSKLHRRRRERRAREGLLVQADGCEHPWLGDRGPKFTLLAGIDDATSRPWAHFWESEDAQGYFRLFRIIDKDRGIPHAWYCDRDSIFAINHRYQIRDPWFDEPGKTQFGRALGEMGVELILANSPQGKGRIERFFDTAQDRLVSLLKLHDARSIDDARRVLPVFLTQFRQRFSVLAREPESAWLPWPDHLNRDDVLCFKFTRVLARDHTISLQGVTYDVPPNASSRPGDQMTVCQWFDRTVRVFQGTQLLVHYPPAQPPHAPSRPAANHPWRKSFLPPND